MSKRKVLPFIRRLLILKCFARFPGLYLYLLSSSNKYFLSYDSCKSSNAQCLNWLIFINEEDGIAKVRTQTGKIGYVKKKQLDDFVTERENLEENNDNNTQQSNILEYDITKKDISTFEKRQNIINLILQEAIKNGKMYVKIINNGTDSEEYQRFKIESVPMLKECGIKIEI